jgi:lipoate-protein ligase A
MELDWATLQHVENSGRLCTIIRIYSWSRPTVSLGKHQQAENAVDLDYCKERGVAVVHRPTGGRAVFHDDEITYAIVSNDYRLFPRQTIQETYALIARALCCGMSEIGIEVEYSPGAPSQTLSPSSGRQTPCFVTPSRFELLHRGRKLIGSAQRRLRQSFLQHGSIALRIDYLEMSRILGFSVDSMRKGIISLSEAAGRDMSFDEVARGLQAGFAQTLRSGFGTMKRD